MKYALILLLAVTFSGCTRQLTLPGAERPDNRLQNGNSDAFEQLEPQSWGKTYYVSGTGRDAGSGRSEKKAFRTLQYAADKTKPGDTVLVMNGTYTKPGPEVNVLDIRNSGKPGDYITYKAYPGHRPLIKVSGNYAGILIRVPYIVIDGFTVEGNLPNLSFEEADRLARGTDEDAALRNYTYNSNGIGSFAEDGLQPHHLIIRNNTVFNNPAGGIFSNNSDYVRIENNVVFNNSYYSAYANSGISFYQSRAVDAKTGVKMWIRNNVVYKNENKVPFWFSNITDPSGRSITDGNGIIIDDSRNTQGTGGLAYTGTFLVQNNLVYDNGGRGINVFESDNVVVRNNTFYRNGRTPNFTEIFVGEASNVEMLANIFSVSPERNPVFSYDTSAVTFDNNLFFGGAEAPQLPGGTANNLIQNGDFNVDLSNWGLIKADTAGFAQDTRDEFGRACVYVDEPDLPNTYDIYLAQTGLTIEEGATYTLTFDVATSNKTKADFTVKIGGSAGSSTPYYAEAISLPVNASATYSRSATFIMTNPTDASAQLELQVAGNPEPTYICFDNIALTKLGNIGGGDNILGEDPLFAQASVDPAAADFRLQQASPAVDAQRVAGPKRDILRASRPKGAASDLGAYESY